MVPLGCTTLLDGRTGARRMSRMIITWRTRGLLPRSAIRCVSPEFSYLLVISSSLSPPPTFAGPPFPRRHQRRRQIQDLRQLRQRLQHPRTPLHHRQRGGPLYDRCQPLPSGLYEGRTRGACACCAHGCDDAGFPGCGSDYPDYQHEPGVGGGRGVAGLYLKCVRWRGVYHNL